MKKLKELLEFKAVPAVGPDANRPTPVSNLQHWGWSNAPLPGTVYADHEYEDEEQSMKREDHFITDIEDDTLRNKNFRKVLYTATNCQLVLMSIPPKGDIGEEVHEAIDQFIRVEKGKGKAIFNDMEHDISDGTAFIVPQGTKHNVINTGKTDLKLYSVYSPPNHMKDTVHRTKKDAERDEEHFDGDTDVQ
jgi:mannose-6-phosphate isomerase-like protein (cupin superfamily)